MKKFLLSIAVIIIAATVLTAPALADPLPAPAAAPLPAGTASPRDWDKLAPGGSLLPSAVKADSAILIDAKTGKVLFEKDADKQWYPASTTKIMTCLLALQSGKQLSDTVTIGKLPNTDFINGAEHIGLVSGEQITFGDLLAGMMVYSGNDAADAVAIYVGGSIDNFVKMMNQKAQELGMTNTNYTCTNGLADDPKHVTTARDMAKLAQVAEKYPEFVKLVSYSSYKMSPDNKHKSPATWRTTNHLLLNDQYGYQFATGIKTGFTTMAKSSFAASAQKNGMTLIAVVMHEGTRSNIWVDTVTMFEYGFANYNTISLNSLLGNQNLSANVKNAAGSDPGQGKLDLVLKPESQAYITDHSDVITALKSDPSQFQQQVNITNDTAPIKKDDKVGTVTFYYEGNPVLVCDLLAARAVDEMATPAPSASLAPTDNASGAPATANPWPCKRIAAASATPLY
jgi:D-alanyl-D-alanine carboxypeptidase